MRKIIYSRPDGGLSIVSLPQDTDEALAKAQAKLPTTAINPQVIDDSLIPTDRTFRNALVHGGNTVIHDMPKAREIAREHIRQARIPRLAALDSEFIRALEDADLAKQAQIKAQKVVLRNAPADPRIVNATNPVALKAARDAMIAEMP